MKNAVVSPIIRAVSPKYPDQYAVDLKPFLLENRPLRWHAVPVAGTVLSAVVMLGLAGCVTAGTPVPPPLEVPLFEHGEGIGVYGCVAITAPVFLSEDDAFAIIRDEFAKLDLIVKPADFTIEGMQVPRLHISNYPPPETIGTRHGDLALDFAVDGRSIMMEFVSASDLREWDSGAFITTVDTYDIKGSAKVLNESLNARKDENIYGVFYDPAVEFDLYDWDTDLSTDWEAEEELARERAIAVLRLQVQDFIAWLAAQGII
ncbi:MAG: hypothetical protein FWF10_09505 [Clostridiales bacterium]|nr:hypothetical protein [Clostridiales bacterium]